MAGGRDANSRYGLAKDRYRGQTMGQQDLTISDRRFHRCTQSKCRLLRLTRSLQLMAVFSFRTELEFTLNRRRRTYCWGNSEKAIDVRAGL